MSDARRPLVRCAREIVERVRHLMPPPGVACIDLVSRWCDGEPVTVGEMRAAAYAANAANAAHAAAYAAHAANAAHAAANAAHAAHAAHNAAYAAYDADIVRRHYPTPPVLR